MICEEGDFLAIAKDSFTPYYQQLVPWINRLRREVFLNNARWKTLRPGLYTSMKEILRKAREDPSVVGDGGEIAVS